jgi:hypothetical protein
LLLPSDFELPSGMNGLIGRTQHSVVNKQNQTLPFPLPFPKTTRSQEDTIENTPKTNQKTTIKRKQNAKVQ